MQTAQAGAVIRNLARVSFVLLVEYTLHCEAKFLTPLTTIEVGNDGILVSI